MCYRSDASKFGLGGYNINSGCVWHYEIPIYCHLRTSLNSLEFIACMVTLWVDAKDSNIVAESCLLPDGQLHCYWVVKEIEFH
jgi:hypothetical protein